MWDEYEPEDDELTGDFIREIRELEAENERLKAEDSRLREIVDKLLDYDHHNMQAGFDEADGAIDPIYYLDAEDEDRLAKEALSEAVQLARKFAQTSRAMNEKAKHGTEGDE
jgi:hypothetical protein